MTTVLDSSFFEFFEFCASSATFLFLPHFDVICDLLLNRRTATWNLFVTYKLSQASNVCRFFLHKTIERFSIAFTANGKRQAEISPKTHKIYLVSGYILPVATAMEQVLKTEKYKLG